MADKNKSGDFYDRPEKLGAWAGFSQFLWNGDTKQFMGRTGSSWGKILLFYAIFYAVLAVFFLSLWFLFASTLVETNPKYKLEESCIGATPGLGFRPTPPESTIDSTLIWFEKNNENNTKYWVKELDSFLKTFETNSSKTVDCRNKQPEAGQSCKIDFEAFRECTSKRGYGYKDGKPCIFLKLNKIYDWEPQYYKDTSLLPDEVPSQLVNHIKNRIRNSKTTDVVWVSCEGERPGDIDNLGTDISYYGLGDEQGFLGRYFPYTKAAGYMQPLVAVKFNSIKPGVIVNIECKAWTQNIRHADFERKDRKGSVHFEIMIDEPKKN